MIGFRLSAAAVLLAGLTLAGAAAESVIIEDTVSDTMAQHHLWSQKFDPTSDPGTTGSIDPQALSGTDIARPQCIPAGLRFSDPPLSDWRIGSCS